MLVKIFRNKHHHTPLAVLPNSELEIIKPIGNITVSSPLRTQIGNYKAENAGSFKGRLVAAKPHWLSATVPAWRSSHSHPNGNMCYPGQYLWRWMSRAARILLTSSYAAPDYDFIKSWTVSECWWSPTRGTHRYFENLRYKLLVPRYWFRFSD